jgi:hypothetical protein
VIVYFGQFFLNTEVALGYVHQQKKSCMYLTKMNWARYWAIFSQTRLVALHLADQSFFSNT